MEGRGRGSCLSFITLLVRPASSTHPPTHHPPTQVGNLPWEMTADGLRQVFHEYNPYDVHIKTNMSGRSRGFGLLRFRSSEEAQRSIEQMHGSTVKDRKILVRLDRVHLEAMGKSPATMEISDAVTCGNIPWHTGDDVLACHMAQGGRLVSCQIQRHADTLRSKGWAIIRYLTPEEGANAVRSLHRTVLDGRTLNVRFYKPNKAASDDATNLYPPAYAVAPLGGEHNPPRRPPHQNGNGNGHMPPMQNGGGQPMMGGYNMHYVQQQHHHLVQQQQMGMGFPQGLRN